MQEKEKNGSLCGFAALIEWLKHSNQSNPICCLVYNQIQTKRKHTRMETDAGFVSYLNVKNMIRQKCSILILC